ncbi:MAG: arylesterase [Candidatus Latescibacterota bacterium]|nr:arylesterase [Candidatus Latescibacterota bacterium]
MDVTDWHRGPRKGRSAQGAVTVRVTDLGIFNLVKFTLLERWDMVKLKRWLVGLCVCLVMTSVNAEERVTVLFLGDSITAGLGIDVKDAFPARIQAKVDSLGWLVTAVNAGLSGETSSGGLRRISWLLKRKIDVMVLELGANDGLRGIDLGLTEKNIKEIITRTKKAYSDCEIIIAGMQMPTNLGPEFTEAFRSLFGKIAEETGSQLIPFLLDGVGGVPELNLPDGKHPTAEGHAILAENVWVILKPILETRTE